MKGLIEWMVGVIIGLILGVSATDLYHKTKQPKQCPGEVVSMVIDKDGAVLCTYMLVPHGVVTKQKEMKK